MTGGVTSERGGSTCVAMKTCFLLRFFLTLALSRGNHRAAKGFLENVIGLWIGGGGAHSSDGIDGISHPSLSYMT